jgi:hypothetical protein
VPNSWQPYRAGSPPIISSTNQHLILNWRGNHGGSVTLTLRRPWSVPRQCNRYNSISSLAASNIEGHYRRDSGAAAIRTVVPAEEGEKVKFLSERNQPRPPCRCLQAYLVRVHKDGRRNSSQRQPRRNSHDRCTAQRQDSVQTAPNIGHNCCSGTNEGTSLETPSSQCTFQSFLASRSWSDRILTMSLVFLGEDQSFRYLARLLSLRTDRLLARSVSHAFRPRGLRG